MLINKGENAMFLASLNEEQKKTFLAIGMKIIGADRRLDKKERQMIEAMRYEMGLFREIILPHGTIEELAKVFDTHRSQSIVLMESIGLAYADADFSKEEQKILRSLALIFGFPEEDATEIENWVLDYRNLLEKAEKIISE
jgi:uncharacterized tellurite resistance protein B-like protein